MHQRVDQISVGVMSGERSDGLEGVWVIYKARVFDSQWPQKEEKADKERLCGETG